MYAEKKQISSIDIVDSKPFSRTTTLKVVAVILMYSIVFLSLLLPTESAAISNALPNSDAINYVIPLTQYQLKTRNGPEKKSDAGLSDFMSAMNEASRLRYGKRAVHSNNYDYFKATEQELDGEPRWPAIKRMSAFSSSGNLPALIDSLNGAERLRFGRK